MRKQVAIHTLMVGTFGAIFTLSAVGQSAASGSSHDFPPDLTLSVRAKSKIDVVTKREPQRQHSCRVKLVTSDKVVCSRALGASHTYRRDEMLALIAPGDDRLRLQLVLGFNSALGAAIWGTVVLAATCPPCAAATGVAAVMFLSAAGATLYADGQPDRLLYLAPGQHLTGKFRDLQP